jgi:hypothetical protein
MSPLRLLQMPLRREQAAKMSCKKNRCLMRPRAVSRSLAISLLLVLLASLGACPDSPWQETRDWKAALALADAAWRRDDSLAAKSAYLRAARVASWRDDWEGILAAACGMKVIEAVKGDYFNTRAMLVLALTGAEKSPSSQGMRAVSKAFAAIGEADAAAMVLSKIRPDWPQAGAETFRDLALWNCWAAG